MRLPEKAAYASLVSAEALALALFNYYVFFANATNHTGSSPYGLLLLFVPALLISLALIPGRRIWLFPLILALAGSVNVIAFDALDIMKGYDSWAHAGMPDRPAWSCIRAPR